MMPYLCLKHKMIKKVQHKSSIALSECIIIAKQLVTAVEVKGLRWPSFAVMMLTITGLETNLPSSSTSICVSFKANALKLNSI